MPAILAPKNTDASGNAFAVYSTSGSDWSATIELYLWTSSPALDPDWTTSTRGVTVTFTPGTGNPYQLYQLALITGSGTPPASVVITSGGASRTVNLLSSGITLSPANPVVALSQSPTNPTIIEIQATLVNLTGTLSSSSWTVPSGATIAPVSGTDWSLVKVSFPSASFSAPSTRDVAVSLGGRTAKTTVFLAPGGTTDSNAAFAYDKGGAFYMAQSAASWATAPENCNWGTGVALLPEPALEVLKRGEYATNLLGNSAIVGIACYVMNFNVFGNLTGAS